MTAKMDLTLTYTITYTITQVIAHPHSKVKVNTTSYLALKPSNTTIQFSNIRCTTRTTKQKSSSKVMQMPQDIVSEKLSQNMNNTKVIHPRRSASSP
jgi:hypothetical protein